MRGARSASRNSRIAGGGPAQEGRLEAAQAHGCVVERWEGEEVLGAGGGRHYPGHGGGQEGQVRRHVVQHVQWLGEEEVDLLQVLDHLVRRAPQPLE